MKIAGVAGVLLLVAATQLNVRFEQQSRERALSHSLYLPTGPYLRYASLGYRAVLADFLYVWSIQYYSELREQRWLNLKGMYEVITDLDPKFETAYTIGALILAAEAGRHQEALALLDRGIEVMPERYSLPMEAGFYAKDIGDHARALAYFARAKRCPDAPAFVARWHAHVAARSGDHRQALQLWLEVAATASTDAELEIAERHIRDYTVRVHIETLEEAVRSYREQRGSWPATLEELVRVGLLESLPVDPHGAAYGYDRTTGEVTASPTFLSRHRLKGRSR